MPWLVSGDPLLCPQRHSWINGSVICSSGHTAALCQSSQLGLPCLRGAELKTKLN